MGIRVHLDFETRSELDVTKVGGPVYAAHPSTEILSLAYRVADEDVVQWKREDIVELDTFGVDKSEELFLLAANKNTIFIAHNALFEQWVWKKIMVEKYGYPKIPIKRWRCTAAKAATYALPRALSEAAKAINLSVRKDMDGNRVMKKLARPRKASKSNPDKFWELHTKKEDFDTLYSYNGSDVLVESELDKNLRDLRPIEQRIWFMDQRMNNRGVTVDLPVVNRALEFLDIVKNELLDRFKEVTNGEVNSPTQRDVFLRWINTNGVNLANLQAAEVDKLLAEHRREECLPENVAEALTIRRKLAQSSTAKYEAIARRVSTDGRLRDILLYYGAARTGRWAGRGVQLQNLKRPNCDIDKAVEALMKYDFDTFAFLYPVMDTLSEIIRGMFIATPGKVLYIADFSAIEARVNAWFSGEESLLQAFRDGECNYCQLATVIYNTEINKKDHPDERQIGKVGELALGYEGGINAFATMAITYRLDMEPAYPSIWARATAEEREKAIKAYKAYARRAEDPVSKKFGLAADIVKQKYRTKRTKIKQMWTDVTEKAIQAVVSGNPVKCSKVTFFTHGVRVKDQVVFDRAKKKKAAETFMVRGKQYVKVKNGNIYEWDSYFLYVKLPSGRCLTYHKPQLFDTKTPWGEVKQQLNYMGVDDKGRYGLIPMYGGKWVENIVQAIARDLMAEAFLRIEDAGYTPLFQVHDEAVSEADEDFSTIDEYEALMAQLPSWAIGLPVKAEGEKVRRYKK